MGRPCHHTGNQRGTLPDKLLPAESILGGKEKQFIGAALSHSFEGLQIGEEFFQNQIRILRQDTPLRKWMRQVQMPMSARGGWTISRKSGSYDLWKGIPAKPRL